LLAKISNFCEFLREKTHFVLNTFYKDLEPPKVIHRLSVILMGFRLPNGWEAMSGNNRSWTGNNGWKYRK
jgi:hypothetical protein